MTNFTSPLFVSGAPVLPGGGVGPFTGNWWFVNPATGSDGNTGAANSPLASLGQAQTNAVANNGDVVVLLGTVHLTATLTWAKAGVHLIGMGAKSNSDRARISSTGVTAFSPLVNVTATGCIFLNIGTFHGGFTGATGSQVCWAEAGERNYYGGCQFYGGGDATTAALAGMRSLTVAGYENVFEDCTIGLDTIVRATNANASLEFLAQSGRNRFRGCLFQSLITDTSDVHVKAAAGSLDRWTLFDKCSFLNAIDFRRFRDGGSDHERSRRRLYPLPGLRQRRRHRDCHHRQRFYHWQRACGHHFQHRDPRHMTPRSL